MFLVPGYRVEIASYRGRPVADAPELRRDFPPGYDGPVTLVTRVDEADGEIRRALMPVAGHHIAVDSMGRRAVFCGMNAAHSALFDVASLRFERLLAPHAGDYIAGGHAQFTPDGKYLLATERKRYDLPARDLVERHGRLVVRDAATLAVLASHDAGGIAPHDLRLTADGRHAVIANYGSIDLPSPAARPRIVEPSVTAVDLATGRIAHKWAAPVNDAEARHVAVHGLDRVAAVLSRPGTVDDDRSLAAEIDAVLEPDLLAEEGRRYMPAPVALFDAARGGEAISVMPEDPLLARQGQSIAYDPPHDEMLVTFTTSHALIVFAADSGRVKRVIHTDRLGLRYPRGVALHPDGAHYAVSGGWQGLIQFRRGEHALVPGRALFPVFFDHSHLTAV